MGKDRKNSAFGKDLPSNREPALSLSLSRLLAILQESPKDEGLVISSSLS